MSGDVHLLDLEPAGTVEALHQTHPPAVIVAVGKVVAPVTPASLLAMSRRSDERGGDRHEFRRLPALRLRRVIGAAGDGVERLGGVLQAVRAAEDPRTLGHGP